MKTIAIVQARMGSNRLPKKVMMKINGTPMIELLLKRLDLSKELDQIILATSTDKNNTPLVEHVQSLGFDCLCGSENDVLKRYADVIRKYKAEVIVRITGDCPLIDPILVDECIRAFNKSNKDYLCNVSPPTFPDGLDIQITSSVALLDADLNAKDPFEREHVMPYIINSKKYTSMSFEYEEDLSENRWTVDENEDLILVKDIYNHFYPNIHFSWLDVLDLKSKKPDIFNVNKDITRNEGAQMGKGQKLWEHAKKVIPGGNMLLSKRAEMFLPDQWPAYFSKSNGCNVWDLDGNKFIDTSLMGVGPNILGYGDPEVDNAVIDVVKNGNMSTLNCAEEVELADRLIAMHPWSDMARFARTGGEANAIAIRIARAATGKDNVAVCGYHGWHDWYISANLASDDGLKEHLIGGLSPNGVPKVLKDTVFPFNYNDIDYLEDLVQTKDIGTIKMEVFRNIEPEDNFLQKVRDLATKNGIVLIFDECTSGFRETFGGLQKKYKVDPDIAMFGKALGNGYAITAILGKEDVMNYAQSTFISSTFWTERIGSAAALKTLERMEDIESWRIITEQGKKVKALWKKLADNNGLAIDQQGLPALCSFSFQSNNHLEYRTYLTQAMLEKGYLASTGFYLSIMHTDDILDNYSNALDPIFKTIKQCEDEKEDIMNLLKGPVCHSGFKRLN